jgi:Na+-driven multidrug efflux pump
VLAGNSAASNVDTVTYQILTAFYSAAVSFSGQNYGAKNLKRIDQLVVWANGLAIAFVLFADVFLFTFPEFFLRLFTNDAAVSAVGVSRIFMMGSGYVIYCISEITIGCVRGMGKSLMPTVLNAVFICGPRMIWMFLVYPHLINGTPSHDYLMLLWCYPVSWALSAIAQICSYLYYRKREEVKFNLEANSIS